uniref:Uncharacterized protein n=1 Tax=Arundo donax TaxID=35708 RepID=A0A0A9CXW8_ARUDO
MSDAWRDAVKQYCSEGNESSYGKLVLVCCLLLSQIRIGQLGLIDYLATAALL